MRQTIQYRGMFIHCNDDDHEYTVQHPDPDVFIIGKHLTLQGAKMAITNWLKLQRNVMHVG